MQFPRYLLLLKPFLCSPVAPLWLQAGLRHWLLAIHTTMPDSGAICLQQDVGADGVSLTADSLANQPNPEHLGIRDL